MTPIYRKRETCCLCGSDRLECAVRLPSTSWLSPNIVRSDATPSRGPTTAEVPLDLYVCRTCGHLQLIHMLPPELLYTNYHYTSSISAGLDRHFDTLVADILERFDDIPAFVFEIGSNDGTVLRKFQSKGCRVLGIDPAHPVVERANQSGVPTLEGYFSHAAARSLAAEHGRASVVIANNVFANLEDLGDIVAGIETVLDPEGIFAFETGYGADVVSGTLLDTIYHEHISYFMVRSLPVLLERHGMQLIDVVHIASKGGSIRCFAQRKGGPRKVADRVGAMIRQEIEAGFDQIDVYKAFEDRVAEIRRRVVAECSARRSQGPIVGYGASVGTVTLLPALGVADLIECIYDDSPLTDAILAAGRRIPVERSEGLRARHPGAVLVFAWRYTDMIVKRHEGYLSDGGRFLIPLPSFRTVP